MISFRAKAQEEGLEQLSPGKKAQASTNGSLLSPPPIQLC